MAAASSSSSSLCVVVLLLLLSTWGGSVALDGQEEDGGAAAAGMACVKNLLPCQAFLQKPDQTPTATCCVPLTEALRTETQCLCSIFNNEALLKSFNVTKDGAMHLLKACNAAVDLKVCNSATNGTSSAAPAGTPPKTNPPASEGSNSPPKSSALSSKSMWGTGTVVAAAWVALLTLAFY